MSVKFRLQDTQKSQTFQLKEVNLPKFAEPPKTHQNYSRNRKKIVAVASSGKGGTGKSTVAVQLAMLFQERNQRTVLVDMDIPHGDIATMLKLSDERCLTDWVGVPKNLNEHQIHNLLLNSANDLKVLPSIRAIEEQEKVNRPEFVRKLMDHLKIFDVIVVDTGPNLEPMTLEVLLLSTDILFVTELYEPALNNIYRGKEEFKKKNGDPHKINVIVNKMKKKSNGIYHSVQRLTGISNISFLPYVEKMPEMTDKGFFLALKKKNHPYVKTLLELVEDISPKVDQPLSLYPKRKGLFSWIGGR
ncbi:P-loop NTPase [Microaerobacter geothermalis]|uniref:AAA family ATPase n=1 Tax=Microaerobacter geothermalis TaxID=674972 RepID=UPI001F204218|nr:P-loop NTPase [Microaerobacter geothermalis]MCF6094310.1 P-loop NTPase [Microaerobacter geothermalis]